MTENADRKRLSDTRGNSAGFLFFSLWLRAFGYRHACGMVWIVSLFYALFDVRARKTAYPYIRHRFPGIGALARFYHIWAIFAHQGKAILACEAVKRGLLKTGLVFGSDEAREIRHSPDGFVILMAHFGPWQALMNEIDVSATVVNIVMRPDANRNVDKMNVLKEDERLRRIRVIPTDSPMGGLWDADAALERGETVAFMADRNLESAPAQVAFLGEKAAFPVAALRLAAKYRRPAVCVFAHDGEKPGTAVMDFYAVLHPETNGRDRNSLTPFAREYAEKLEEMCGRYPHDCFLFEDLWRTPGAEWTQLNGIGWMVEYICAKTVRTPEKQNHFSIRAELAGRLDADAVKRQFEDRLRGIRPWLTGRVKRLFWRRLPIWQPNPFADLVPPVEICGTEDEFEAFPTLALKRDEALEIAIFTIGNKTRLLFKFSHRLFDGIGAEKIVNALCRGEEIEYAPPPSPVENWPSIRAAGQRVREFQSDLKTKKIATLPGGHGRALFRRIEVTPAQRNILADRAERRYGPFSFSLAVFAQVMVRAEELFRARGAGGDWLNVPMSVDLRRKNGMADQPFFNQWSVMPLTLPRVELDTEERAFRAIRKAYFAGLAAHTAETYAEAALAMRYLPKWGIDPFVRSNRGGTVGSVMFSFLDDAIAREIQICGGRAEKIVNAWHLPVMPPVNPLGFFVNLFDGGMNVVISTRSGDLSASELTDLAARLDFDFNHRAATPEKTGEKQ